MIVVNNRTRQRIQRLFPQHQWAEVENLLLRECGDNLPFIDPGYRQLAERIRFAVLKLSGGDMKALRRELREAAIDWRDVLVAAGFGNTRAHRSWKPKSSK